MEPAPGFIEPVPLVELLVVPDGLRPTFCHSLSLSAGSYAEVLSGTWSGDWRRRKPLRIFFTRLLISQPTKAIIGAIAAAAASSTSSTGRPATCWAAATISAR